MRSAWLVTAACSVPAQERALHSGPSRGARLLMFVVLIPPVFASLNARHAATGRYCAFSPDKPAMMFLII